MVKNISLHGEVLVPDEEGKMRKLTLGKIMWTDGMGRIHKSYTLVPPDDNTGGGASSAEVQEESKAREEADKALQESLQSLEENLDNVEKVIDDLGVSSLGYYESEIDLGKCLESELESILFASSAAIARWDALYSNLTGYCKLYKIKILVTPNGKTPAPDETEPSADAGVTPEPELWQGYFLTMTGYRIASEEDNVAWTQTLMQRLILDARPCSHYFDRTRTKTNTYYTGIGERFSEGISTEWYNTSTPPEETPSVSAVSFLNMPVGEEADESEEAYYGEIASESKEGIVEVDEDELIEDNMEVAAAPSGTVTLFNELPDATETTLEEPVYLNQVSVEDAPGEEPASESVYFNQVSVEEASSEPVYLNRIV